MVTTADPEIVKYQGKLIDTLMGLYGSKVRMVPEFGFCEYEHSESVYGAGDAMLCGRDASGTDVASGTPRCRAHLPCPATPRFVVESYGFDWLIYDTHGRTVVANSKGEVESRVLVAEILNKQFEERQWKRQSKVVKIR